VSATIGPESDRHAVGAVMLFVATALALRAHGLFHLHAGCVLVPGLGTVLIVGESGSGKTSLSVALAALGGALVSDDAVFLSNGVQGRVEVVGWPADLHLAPTTLGAFPELAARAYRPVSDGRDKRAVPLEALPRPWLPSAQDPRLVLFPVVGGASRSCTRRLDASEVVARLIPQSGLAVIPGAAKCAEHLRLLAEVANNAVGLEITLGADALCPGPPFLEILGAGIEEASGRGRGDGSDAGHG
jgi:HPr kinase/phosphorylase